MDVVQEIKILQRRLYELQKHMASNGLSEELPQGELSLLMTTVGTEEVAVSLSMLEEAVMVAQLTPLAEAPPWVAGLLNLRGELIPVIDVLARMEGGSREVLQSDLILICEVSERRVGLIVQGVAGIEQVQGTDIKPRPDDVPFAPYLMGTLHRDDDVVLVLSLQTLVATSELPLHES